MKSISPDDSKIFSDQDAKGGVFKGTLDDAPYEVPALRFRKDEINLTFATHHENQPYDERVHIYVKPEFIGQEVNIPEDAHVEMHHKGVLNIAKSGEVKISLDVAGKNYHGSLKKVTLRDSADSFHVLEGIFSLSFD